MNGLDPYLAQRSLENRLCEIQQGVEIGHVSLVASGAPRGRLTETGRRLLLESGTALSALGAWLGEQGGALEQPFDGQAC
jgi:hypothetical protein